MEIGKEIGGRFPGVHYWEQDDPRLLVCEAYSLPGSILEKVKNNLKSGGKTSARLDNSTTQDEAGNYFMTNECLVVSMFFNADKGLLVYDSYSRGEIYSKLISVKIPSHFFVTKVRKNTLTSSLISSHLTIHLPFFFSGSTNGK